jgi:TonB family protein
MNGVGAPSLGPPPPAARPKLALESITGGSSSKPNPNPANLTAKLDLPKPAFPSPRPPGGGGPAVGDIGEPAPAISGAPIQAPCQECSTLQLLSDPQNVDFKPYLQQVLAVVKRNWLSVIPESARLGRRGLVLLQFSIDRRGLVPKVVIASPSGVEAFDRAAVAGLSMSNPLPPLPADYKGDQVRLQMAFSYNVPPQR